MNCGFLYFIPGGSPEFDHAALAAAGLGHVAADGEPLAKRGVVGGPGSADGLLVAVDATMPVERLRYGEGYQTWRRVPKSPAWCGMWQNSRPGPDELARPEQLPGHLVRLEDGRDWLAPKAVIYDAAGQVFRPYVPCAVDWDDDGRRIDGEVIDAYRELWDVAERWNNMRATAELTDRVARFAECIDASMAVVALTVNYRVGLAEVALLRLFTSDCRREVDVLDALLDMPAFNEHLKKNEEPAT